MKVDGHTVISKLAIKYIGVMINAELSFKGIEYDRTNNGVVENSQRSLIAKELRE